LLRYVPAKAWNLQDLPDGELMWYAQEDIWLQRGLLDTVAKANHYVAQFKRADNWTGTEQDKVFTFYNPYWRLDLKRTNDTRVTGTLTNISRKRQRLDVSFLLQVSAPSKNSRQEPRKMEIEAPGESLPPGKSLAIDQELEGAVAPEGIF